jgi:hypothetical protein
MADEATGDQEAPDSSSVTSPRPPSGSSGSKSPQPKYPRHDVERALRIPRAIYEQNGGKPATNKEAATFLGANVTGAFNVEVSSAKKYGCLEPVETGCVGVTQRARKAIAPQSPTARIDAPREAVLAAPEILDVYDFYRGEDLPDPPYLINAITDKFGIPQDKVPEFLSIFMASIQAAELLEQWGDRARLIGVGRDKAHRAEAEAPAKARSSGGAKRAAAQSSHQTCFVMQPFGGFLGSYCESSYKPAIEQAGLVAVRADSEIFGAGKVMDQVWRGIRAESVLVAELTTKNANVFYELGPAHPLEKPVVLIASNQEDVPFDLRHIHMILYDQTDPFWGPKLIDKVADMIKSAIDNPEEAIFRVSD